ncbi:MAG: hypothetical protein AAFY71_02665 [Bacteroidota bacterium]
MCKSFILILFLFFGLFSSCQAQDAEDSSERILFHINSNVKNQEADYFQEIVGEWKAYLQEGTFFSLSNSRWNDHVPMPDYPYASLLFELRALTDSSQQFQCTILGIIPTEKDFYQLKAMFSKEDESTCKHDISHIISVYAKANKDSYHFFNATQYYKAVYPNKKVGQVNYIIHPEHDFNLEEAKKMSAFNTKMAALFEEEPIAFDYVLANNTDDIGKMMGMEFFPFSMMAVQSGGMADNYNKVIYAGNNSAYYPHEVVHLYTYIKYAGQYHSWVDEGIAAYFGGSTGYKLEWHLQKLKTFLEKNPDFPLDNLTALQTDVPNGEYTTDFRYAIGGYLMGKIYEKEGMEGFFEALQAGRAEADYFAYLKEKFGFEQEEFGDFIKAEMKKLKKIPEEELDTYRY